MYILRLTDRDTEFNDSLSSRVSLVCDVGLWFLTESEKSSELYLFFSIWLIITRDLYPPWLPLSSDGLLSRGYSKYWAGPGIIIFFLTPKSKNLSGIERPNPASLLEESAPLILTVSGLSYYTLSTSILGPLNLESFPNENRWLAFELLSARVLSRIEEALRPFSFYLEWLLFSDFSEVFSGLLNISVFNCTGKLLIFLLIYFYFIYYQNYLLFKLKKVLEVLSIS